MITVENVICSWADGPVAVPVNGCFYAEMRVAGLMLAPELILRPLLEKYGHNIRYIPLHFQSLAWFTEALNEFKKNP
jgi:hypothetical protein